MFTLNDVRNIAIQIERNGEAVYRSAGKKATDPKISQMLNWMADEERRHRQWFESLRVVSQSSKAHDEIETMGQSLLQEMIKNQAFSLEDADLHAVSDILHLLSQSLEFERDTIIFYEMLRAFIEEPDTIEQLNAIIGEEREHVKEFERLHAIYTQKQKANKPG